jgi:hypothetical protein
MKNFQSKMLLLSVTAAMVFSVGGGQVFAGGFKVKAPGKFQQRVIVAAGVGAAQGGYKGAAAGAAGVIIQNHAEKRWIR